MKRYSAIAVVFVISLFSTTAAAAPLDYNQILFPSFGGNTSITWNVIDSPNVPVAWGWTNEGSWFIEDGSTISFSISEVHSDVEGTLRIGNFTIDANNTDIARELVLGVWGLTQFFPGLVVPVGEDNLEGLNATAYDSAMRVQGNYLNGTMTSSYEDITIGMSAYSCIVFNFVQDTPFFGEAQKTVLAYDTTTGILVRGNTSYSFGEPYSLVIELSSVIQNGVLTSSIVLASIWILAGVLAIIAFRRR